MVLTNRDEVIQGLSRRTPKSSINDVLAFVINELESSSRLGYSAIHQKLLMNGFIIDHEGARLILKEQRARHSLNRRTCNSSDPNQTWHVDRYNKLKPFGFAIHGAIDGYSQAIAIQRS